MSISRHVRQVYGFLNRVTVQKVANRSKKKRKKEREKKKAILTKFCIASTIEKLVAKIHLLVITCFSTSTETSGDFHRTLRPAFLAPMIDPM